MSLKETLQHSVHYERCKDRCYCRSVVLDCEILLVPIKMWPLGGQVLKSTFHLSQS